MWTAQSEQLHKDRGIRVTIDVDSSPVSYREVLHLWRLRAVAYSDPGFDHALQATLEDRADEFVPAEQAIPGWSDRL